MVIKARGVRAQERQERRGNGDTYPTGVTPCQYRDSQGIRGRIDRSISWTSASFAPSSATLSSTLCLKSTFLLDISHYLSGS